MKIAALTTAYNEPVFLPIWRQYYGQALGEEHLFVVDHGSDDGSTDNVGAANRVRIPRGEFDEDQRCTFVSRLQASLLCYYDAVIFSDTDEILVPDPEKYSGLVDFVTRRCEQFVTAIGLEVQHLTDTEADIDLGRPILAQRRYVQFAPEYCKPLVSRIPLVWKPGFHDCDLPPSIAPDLFLFHLRRMDRKLAVQRLRRMRDTKWSKNALDKQHWFHFRWSEDEFTTTLFRFSAENVKPHLVEWAEFERRLCRPAGNSDEWHRELDGVVVAIPDRFRRVIAGPEAATVALRRTTWRQQLMAKLAARERR
ncbi:MAG: glycosyltransferase family 2 protein [Stellaceae bacterium]